MNYFCCLDIPTRQTGGARKIHFRTDSSAAQLRHCGHRYTTSNFGREPGFYRNKLAYSPQNTAKQLRPMMKNQCKTNDAFFHKCGKAGKSRVIARWNRKSPLKRGHLYVSAAHHHANDESFKARSKLCRFVFLILPQSKTQQENLKLRHIMMCWPIYPPVMFADDLGSVRWLTGSV